MTPRPAAETVAGLAPLSGDRDHSAAGGDLPVWALGIDPGTEMGVALLRRTDAGPRIERLEAVMLPGDEAKRARVVFGVIAKFHAVVRDPAIAGVEMPLVLSSGRSKGGGILRQGRDVGIIEAALVMLTGRAPRYVATSTAKKALTGRGDAGLGVIDGESTEARRARMKAAIVAAAMRVPGWQARAKALEGAGWRMRAAADAVAVAMAVLVPAPERKACRPGARLRCAASPAVVVNQEGLL